MNEHFFLRRVRTSFVLVLVLVIRVCVSGCERTSNLFIRVGLPGPSDTSKNFLLSYFLRAPSCSSWLKLDGEFRAAKKIDYNSSLLYNSLLIKWHFFPAG